MSNLKLPNLSYAALDARLPQGTAPLGAGRSHTIGYNTRAYRFHDAICIQHHDTTIATLGALGSVHITNGGYGSSTTRARLHSILIDNRVPYRLGQKDYVQVLSSADRSDTHRDFLSAYFSPDGVLIAFNGQDIRA